MNYFEVFGLERRLGLDVEVLQARFYALSRRHHPDFHQSGTPEAQAKALQTSALVNAAYRTLRDPIARIEYLIRLEEGRETNEGASVKPTAPPALLAEMFEIQEALQEARSGGLSPDVCAPLAAERDRLIARQRAVEDGLRGRQSVAWDAAAPAERPRLIDDLKEALATRAYLTTVIDDLEAALEESQDGHVAHRRD